MGGRRRLQLFLGKPCFVFVSGWIEERIQWTIPELGSLCRAKRSPFSVGLRQCSGGHAGHHDDRDFLNVSWSDHLPGEICWETTRSCICALLRWFCLTDVSRETGGRRLLQRASGLNKFPYREGCLKWPFVEQTSYPAEQATGRLWSGLNIFFLLLKKPSGLSQVWNYTRNNIFLHPPFLGQTMRALSTPPTFWSKIILVSRTDSQLIIVGFFLWNVSSALSENDITTWEPSHHHSVIINRTLTQ